MEINRCNVYVVKKKSLKFQSKYSCVAAIHGNFVHIECIYICFSARGYDTRFRIIVMITVTSGGSVPGAFFIRFLPSSFAVAIVGGVSSSKSARPRSAGGNCTVPGALYVPEVSRDLRFSLVMRETPSNDDVGRGERGLWGCWGCVTGRGSRGGGGRGFHRGGCARLSRHALMRRRGYGGGLYKVLINGIYAFSLRATRWSSIHRGVPCARGLWKPMKSELSLPCTRNSAPSDSSDRVGDILESRQKRGRRDRALCEKIPWSLINTLSVFSLSAIIAQIGLYGENTRFNSETENMCIMYFLLRRY